jgi:hypothetical protein
MPSGKSGNIEFIRDYSLPAELSLTFLATGLGKQRFS